MRIITDLRNTEQTVSFAGEELARYLERMLPGEEGVFSVSLEVSPSGSEDTDSFSVGLSEHGGTITGNNSRSVLLGVYDYLRHLGCRFLSPGRENEVVPTVTRKALPARYTRRASFRHRGVCIEGGNSLENVLDFIDWLPKLGCNSFFIQFKVPYIFLSRWYHHDRNPYREAEPFTMEDAERCMEQMEEAMTRRSLLLHKVGHGWTGEVLGGPAMGSWDTVNCPIAEDKRPLAAMVNGKRDFHMGIPTNTNLCFSNPRTIRDFAELVVDYARKNSAVDCLHIWLADDYNNVCRCDGCRKTTIADQYVMLLNEIDRRLTEERLPTRIVFLLYQELLWPPVRERLRNPDRFLLMFAPISRTFEASYDLSEIPEGIVPYVANHITPPVNLGENLAFLRAWQKTFSGEGFAFDYPLGRAHYGDFGYLHISRIISQDIRKLREMGLDGYISCQELRVAMPNALPNYVMGYTLFDETAEVEDLIREYYTAAYPEKPELARAFLEELSRLSSCDYLNGKGPRVREDIARRMSRITALCLQQQTLEANYPQGAFWEVLRCHTGYILRLAAALEAMALGDEEETGRRYLEMRRYICEKEPRFQPWLDVFRVLEVTQNYTGFRIDKSM